MLDSRSYVYFLRPVGFEGPVKIGSSLVPQRRLRVYANIAPFPLELAATYPGGAELEGRLHQRFRHLRYHHEWFRADPDLTRVIDMARRGELALDELPAAVPFRTGRPVCGASGFRGVSRHSRGKAWQAKIRAGYQHIYLGLFATAEEAARAYDTAASEIFGDRARLNFPAEQPHRASSIQDKAA